jgi:pyrroline-5-carboxylate reductase
MKDVTIAFIGGGNMTRSLIGGLLADGISPQNIWVADPNEAALHSHHSNFAVYTSPDNSEAVRNAQVVVLAVKPQVAKSVVQGLTRTIKTTRPLVISIVAGIRESHLREWLGEDMAIVRTMPNTAALVGSSATALFANTAVSKEQKNQAESILRAVGMTLWVDDEALMDTVTALSGSGPAYFFLIMEALEDAGHRLGLPRNMAHLLTLQTAFGAAKMALESTETLGTLRQRVTSPGGTTERAVRILREHHVAEAFDEALRTAYQRSAELATLFGGKK